MNLKNGKAIIKNNLRVGKSILGLMVSFLFIILLIRKIDVTEVLRLFGSIKYNFVLPAVVFHLLSFYFRSIRWKILLSPLKRIDTNKLFSLTAISFALNHFLPFRLGELIKIHMLGKSEGISRSSIMASVLFEKLSDMFALLLILSCILSWFPFPSTIKQGGYVILIVSSVSICLLIILRKNKEFFTKLLLFEFIPLSIRELFKNKMELFIDGLRFLKSNFIILRVVVLSIIINLVFSLNYHYMFMAYNLSQLPIYASIVTLIIVSFGAAVPSSAGQIGLFEYFVVLGLSLFGVDENLGLTIALACRAQRLITTNILAIFFVVKDNIPLMRLKQIITGTETTYN